MREESDIVKLVSRKLIPFIFLFGLYLISYGHLSPGGGFQGGVVLGAGVILLCISQGFCIAKAKVPVGTLKILEIFMLILFLTFGVCGILTGKGFLGSLFPVGRIGAIPSAGNVLFLNLVIGLKVACAISAIFYFMVYLKREE